MALSDWVDRQPMSGASEIDGVTAIYSEQEKLGAANG